MIVSFGPIFIKKSGFSLITVCAFRRLLIYLFNWISDFAQIGYFLKLLVGDSLHLRNKRDACSLVFIYTQQQIKQNSLDRQDSNVSPIFLYELLEYQRNVPRNNQ